MECSSILLPVELFLLLIDHSSPISAPLKLNFPLDQMLDWCHVNAEYVGKKDKDHTSCWQPHHATTRIINYDHAWWWANVTTNPVNKIAHAISLRFWWWTLWATKLWYTIWPKILAGNIFGRFITFLNFWGLPDYDLESHWYGRGQVPHIPVHEVSTIPTGRVLFWQI